MRRSLLNKQFLPKPLRQALVLITLLLLPSAAWGEELVTTNAPSGSSWSIDGFSNYAWTISSSSAFTEGSGGKIDINFAGNPLTLYLAKPSDGKNRIIKGITLEGYEVSNDITVTAKFSGDWQTRTFTNNYYELDSPVEWGEESITLTFTASDNSKTSSINSIKVTTEIVTSYNLNIAGTEVTSVNADNITNTQTITSGTVTFNASTNTLTLNGAKIVGSITYTGNSDLTVEINGENTVGNQSTFGELSDMNTDNENRASLIIKGSDNSSLSFDAPTSSSGSSISGFADVTLDGVYLQSESYCHYVINQFNGRQNGYKDINGNYVHKLTFTTVPQYPLWISGKQVNENNASNVLSDATSSVSYDDNNKELTLNGATITGNIVKSSSADDKTLIVNLDGNNTLNGTFFFNDQIPGDLTFTGTGSLTITSESIFDTSVNSVNTANGLYLATDDPNLYTAPSATISPTVAYPIWVYNSSSTTKYTQLTANASSYTTAEANVDENHKGSVSYSTNTNTLTLDNFFCKTTENSAYVFQIGGSLTNLTVNLKGTNETSHYCFNYLKPTDGDDLQLTYTTSNNGSLEFDSDPNEWNMNFAYDKGLGYYPWKISTDWPRLQIGNTYVRGTAESVVGYSNIKYDDESKTLTLSGTTINNSTNTDISVYLDDLTVEISGTNTIYGRFWGQYRENGSAAGTITFKKNKDAETASLTISGIGGGQGPVTEFSNCLLSDGIIITGAKNGQTPVDVNEVTYNNSNFVYGSQNNVLTEITLSALFSEGDGSTGNPFIIKTPQDLKNFSTYINNGVLSNENFLLGNDIDCEEISDFEPIGSPEKPFKGTFSGGTTENHTIKNLTINSQDSNVGLFGYVGEDGSQAVIEKLTLFNVDISGGYQTGAIAGVLTYGSEIKNCIVNSSKISCSNSAGTAYTGGIVGDNRNSTISYCQVSSSTITAVSDENDYATTIAAGGIAGNNDGGDINNCEVTGATNAISNFTNISDMYVYAGAIIGHHNTGNSESKAEANVYESSVTTTVKGVEYKGQTQRGIGNDNPHDIPNQVMMAGTKKVTISATGISGDRTLSLGEMDTYCLEERSGTPEQLTALYVLPETTISLVVSSENGYKPTFTLSNSDVVVPPEEEEFANDFWTIKFDFEMPEDDVTATIAFARDLASQLYTLSTDKESYTYTGKGIEPSLSLTISTDPDNPVALTKGTDYEILKCMKKVEETFTPIFEEDGKTPKTPVDAGFYQVSISGIGSYTGKAVLEFEIKKADAGLFFYHLVDGEEEEVQSVEEATYGKAYDAPKLKNPFNLAVSLSCNATNAENGTPSDVATIDDDGNLTILKAGTVYVYAVTEENENCNGGNVHYQLDISKGSLADVTITEIENQVYTSSPIEPELTVTAHDGKTSVTTDDYSITYSNNTNVGEATITLTAKETSEKFEGSTTTTFTIEPLVMTNNNTTITLNYTELTYNGSEQTVSVTKVEVNGIVVDSDNYLVDDNKGTEAGEYTVTVTAKPDNDNFKNNFAGSAEKEWRINHRTASAAELGFESETQTSSTYYNPNESFNLPEGYVGYIITGINGTEVLTTRVSYIPKGVAVLVEKGTSSDEATENITNTDLLPLKGTVEPLDVISITGGTVYVLYNGEFVKSTSGTIPGKRCYLLVATSVAAGTRSFSIDHGDGTTGIKGVKSDEVKGEKWTDDKWHDLQGRSIEKPTKAGLYIKNGKKVVIK